MIIIGDVELEVTPSDEIALSAEETNETFEIAADSETQVTMSNDYNDLKNKPTLNGETIIGDVEEKDPTVSSWAKTETRPVYTADDVGAVSKGDIVDMSIETLKQIWDAVT